MSIPLLTITFNDGTTWAGGNLREPKWRESPEKPIQSITLLLPTGDFLLINGYEQYNFFVEAVAGVLGSKGTQLTFIYIMGVRGGMVTSYRVSIGDYGNHKSGDIFTRQFPQGKEYDGKPTTGWHRGA